MTTKCLVLSTKRLVAAAKFLVTKNLFVVPNFVAVTKPFFPLRFEHCKKRILNSGATEVKSLV